MVHFIYYSLFLALGQNYFISPIARSSEIIDKIGITIKIGNIINHRYKSNHIIILCQQTTNI